MTWALCCCALEGAALSEAILSSRWTGNTEHSAVCCTWQACTINVCKTYAAAVSLGGGLISVATDSPCFASLIAEQENKLAVKLKA